MKQIIASSCFVVLMSVLIRCTAYEFPIPPYPTAETHAATNISNSGITFHGSLEANGASTILDHGFIWGPIQDIFFGLGDQVSLGPPTETDFDVAVTYGLLKNEEMYVRAYVTTSEKVIYGDPVEFVSQGSSPPAITSFTPSAAPVGAEVTISGSNFSGNRSYVRVSFGSTNAPILSTTDKSIVCLVPGFPGSTSRIVVTVLGTQAQAPGVFAKN